MDRDIIFAAGYGGSDYIVVDHASGQIKKLGKGVLSGQADVRLPAGAVIQPGDFNAHSHPEQSIYVEIADKKWELAKWCRETIYRYSTSMTYERIYYGCVRAFGRMLSYGETSVMVSFYCHNKMGNTLDRAVINAARDVGIRLYFGRMNYDIITAGAYNEKHESQLSYYETPQEAESNFIELLSEEGPTVKIAPALHSFHANTLEGIVKGINLGSEYGRKVQMHLSEDEGDVKLCLDNYGKRPVEVLASMVETGQIQKLDHVLLSDCVWTDEHEKHLIKELGMSVIINGRMNDRVKAGRAAVSQYLKMGIPLYVGTDGEASNDDLSIKNERNWLAGIHSLSSLETELLLRPFEMGGAKVGTIEAGAMGDFQVFKDGRLSALYVGGRQVMYDGVVASKDLIDEADEYIRKMWRESV